MSTGWPKDGDTQLALAEQKSGLPPRPPSRALTAIVEYEKPVFKEEEEDLEVKLRRIIENVLSASVTPLEVLLVLAPYRQMRRKEQDRLARMDADYQKRKELAEFIMRREERLKAAEERTAKKRFKQQKRKQRKKDKKLKSSAEGEDNKKEDSSDDEGDSENDETAAQ
ncbi:hypothetical protein PTKIN_Ptkin02bG0176000 [Pterospermum kingtungense]